MRLGFLGRAFFSSVAKFCFVAVVPYQSSTSYEGEEDQDCDHKAETGFHLEGEIKEINKGSPEYPLLNN